MLRIYGSARSRGVRTLWMAGELGLQYEHLDYAPRSPQTRTPEYLALNPNARVPTIDDDGFVLSESMAINLYLAKKHGKLYPTDAKNEALTWQWSLWETDRLDRQLTTYANNAFVLPEVQRNSAAAKGAWDEITAALDVLEIALGKTQWLAGGEFSVADLNVAAAMVRALGFDIGTWPKVHAWLHKCWDRPAAKRALAMRE
jgi:glutathione S-transferase